MRVIVLYCSYETCLKEFLLILFQMKILHMGGFSATELIQYRNAMRGNVIDAMTTVLREIDRKSIEFQREVKL
jgi:hypothetical protein